MSDDSPRVLITGAAQGMGRAMARAFAGAGYRLVLSDLAEDRLGAVLAEVEALPEAKQIETLETARQRHEAMQAGVEALTAALRAGHVKIAGVMPDAWPAWETR